MFGMGFSEIIIILIIAILFLGPDKLPSAMVDIAKFFRNMKKTVSSVKDSIEEEMSVSEIKEEALAYKKELLQAKDDLNKVNSMSNIGDLSDLADTFIDDTSTKKETITFQNKSKKEDINV